MLVRLTLSVVIPTRNRCNTLALVLSSLAEQRVSWSLPMEVIIVDDESTDETEQIVRRFENLFAKLTYLRVAHGEPPCLSRLRNTGLRKTSGTLVMFLDSDVVLASDAVDHIARAYTPTGGGQVLLPKILGVYSEFRGYPASLFRCEPHSIDDTIAKYARDSAWQDPRDELMVYGGQGPSSHLPAPWTLGWTGCLVVSREALERTEGFDESFVGWGSEDTEFCYRLYKEGAKFLPVLRAKTLHVPTIGPESSATRSHLNTMNRERFRQLHYQMDAELYLYYGGRYFNQVLARWNAFVSSSVLPFADQALARRILEIAPCPNNNLSIGFDQAFFLDALGAADINIQNPTLVSHIQNQFPDRRVHYRLGCVSPYNSDHFQSVIISEVWRILPDRIFSDLIRESARISKQVVLVYTPQAVPEPVRLDNLLWRAIPSWSDRPIDGLVWSDVEGDLRQRLMIGKRS